MELTDNFTNVFRLNNLIAYLNNAMAPNNCKFHHSQQYVPNTRTQHGQPVTSPVPPHHQDMLYCAGRMEHLLQGTPWKIHLWIKLMNKNYLTIVSGVFHSTNVLVGGYLWMRHVLDYLLP